MASRLFACAAFGVAMAGLVTGCSSPFDQPHNNGRSLDHAAPDGVDRVPSSRYRNDENSAMPLISADSTPDDYVRYALYNSPQVETAYQNWRAAAERMPQVGALPDPRLRFGFFLNEVETRVGPQQAVVGVQQTFPWPGKLRDREDAASKASLAAWRRFEAARLAVAEQAISTLLDLAYLDATIGITEENLALLVSFEEVVRARYRVGAGSHPALIQVQVELGQLEDRLLQLQSMRPAYLAALNAVLNRPSSAEVFLSDTLPMRIASVDADELAEIARRSNPVLLALDEQVEEQRFLTDVARKDGLPDLTLGLDYFVTGDAIDSSIPESGDDPILLSFGINVPLWREKYDAGVRESIARRLSVANERADQANRIAAGIQRAWFEHTDADRRVRLYEQTLIPKAEESLRASLAGFRAGDTSFLDLLDTERTLLEFEISAERARSDSGKALARLNTLVGEPVPTEATNHAVPDGDPGEAQP